MLEQQQAQLVVGFHRLYKLTQNGEGWTLPALTESEHDYSFAYDIIERLGTLGEDSPERLEVTEDNLDLIWLPLSRSEPENNQRRETSRPDDETGQPAGQNLPGIQEMQQSPSAVESATQPSPPPGCLFPKVPLLRTEIEVLPPFGIQGMQQSPSSVEPAIQPDPTPSFLFPEVSLSQTETTILPPRSTHGTVDLPSGMSLTPPQGDLGAPSSTNLLNPMEVFREYDPAMSVDTALLPFDQYLIRQGTCSGPFHTSIWNDNEFNALLNSWTVC